MKPIKVADFGEIGDNLGRGVDLSQDSLPRLCMDLPDLFIKFMNASMNAEPRTLQLAEWLIGEFDNKAQSMEDPAWYVPLRLWHRPLPHRIHGQLAIFAEQSNFLELDKPYRQRILALEQEGDRFLVQFWAFKDPAYFRGAGANPERLIEATESALEALPGCRLNVDFTGDRYRANPEPDSRCCFTYDEKIRQVVLGFEASATQFLSYDRGVDPETGQSLWGAMMGPYRHQKRCNYDLRPEA
jgi:CpeT/CpcT family (DUF1001)